MGRLHQALLVCFVVLSLWLLACTALAAQPGVTTIRSNRTIQQPQRADSAPGGTAAVIALTELGCQPAAITVTVDMPVRWVNHTNHVIRIADQALPVDTDRNLYLPLVAQQTRSDATAEAGTGPDGSSRAATWASTPIEPAEAWVHTFPQAGTYPYYTNHRAGVAGVITVITDAVRLEIAPGSLLLTTPGEHRTLTAYAIDAQGNAALAPAAWSSSHPDVIDLAADGQVTAVAARGSALIYAQYGDLAAAPASAIVARPVADAVLIYDDQVLAPPAPLSAGAEPGVGWQAQVVLRSTAPLTVGAILLAAESAPIFGRAIAIEAAGDVYTATLETVPLTQGFSELTIAETVRLVHAGLNESTVGTAMHRVRSSCEGHDASLSLPWTYLRPPVLGASAPSYVARHAPGGDTAPAASIAPDGALAPGSLSLGPFNCVTSAGIELGAQDVAAAVQDNLTLTYGLDIADATLQHVLVELTGELTATITGTITVSGHTDAAVTCQLNAANYAIPVGGPLSQLFLPVVPVGVGFGMSGTIEADQLELRLLGGVGGALAAGFEYRPGSGITGLTGLTVFDDAGIGLQLPGAPTGFRFVGMMRAFGSTGVGLAHLPAGRASATTWQLLQASAGIRQDADLRPLAEQAADAQYASGYALKTTGLLAAGADVTAFFTLIDGVTRPFELHEERGADLAQSPAGSIPPSESVYYGVPVDRYVALDPSKLAYPQIGYNIASVRIDAIRAGQLETVAEFPAKEGYFYFEWDWTPARTDGGEHAFIAYAMTHAAPFAPLELTPDAIRTIFVITNHQPTAIDDVVYTPINTPVDIDVLANDIDLDGDPLSITAVNHSWPGQATATAIDGMIRYTPTLDYLRNDRFLYYISDGQQSDIGAAYITIKPYPAYDPDATITVPAGEFQMGCDGENPTENNCYYKPTALPLHTVYLDAYRIDQHEVTNARYATCVAAGACTRPAKVSSNTHPSYYNSPAYTLYPVIYVSWGQAAAFCSWAGGRLPSEAEWEKAARGAGDTRKFPWGNDPPTCAHANYAWGDDASCYGLDTDQVGMTGPGASPYGGMDMTGNVSEWVNDWYQADYYAQSPASNPPGPATGSWRVRRGGSWDSDFASLYANGRSSAPPDVALNDTGFRCVYPP